ncbi:MAG: hypothetical protein GYB53_15410 [Rhodobacteraceae bacterium]|nr:hypothetical protein [Paracoccaceae bacterium]MBR9820176.1 hypothetical protein [Paracoccaceae bacterium]
MQEKFYMVKGDGPTSVRHPSREIAEREAKRLARENPGTPFFVMMAVDGFVKDDVRHIDIRPPEAEIPF